jgi:ribonucleoside-diphosphate reductase alpha chain
MNLKQLKKDELAPEWMTSESLQTLCNGYLYNDETPKDMYKRLAKTSASYYNKDKKYENKVFDYLWNGWLSPATPVASNFGTDRGLPISCFTIHPADDTYSIFQKAQELAMLSKYGGGVGIFLGDIRGKGVPISKGGISDGVVPWAKVYDSTTIAVNQSGIRRGNSVVYLPIEHADIDEFLDLRRPTGDPDRRCMNIHHAVCITNAWFDSMLNGDKKKRATWKKILTSRFEVGEPYLFFTDNVNDQNPQCYKKNKLNVKSSNLCSEITLYTDSEHSFVCCLSSLNLAKWEEWKDTDLVETSIKFLDSVITEFVLKASKIQGFDASVRSAEKGRALGLGVLGWHSLLQSKIIPFDSFDAMQLNNLIFKTIRERADKETEDLAKEFGEPEWCKGFGRRNTHTLSVAPTFSSSIICQSVSAGIEPWAANVFSHKTAKGTFIRKNVQLEGIIKELNHDSSETWDSIISNGGSVQHLDFLSAEIKQVFLTAREINQFAIVKQAVQRQKYIDQGQSLNLFFPSNASPKYINDVHLEAWKSGLKTLYYCRTEGVLKGDLASRNSEDCAACEA